MAKISYSFSFTNLAHSYRSSLYARFFPQLKLLVRHALLIDGLRLRVLADQIGFCSLIARSPRDFPPTALATFCQRSGVSLSYTARAFSNCLFCLCVHDELGEPEEVKKLDAISLDISDNVELENELCQSF
ncbi:hypothetical protein O6P43_016179 [Quillaja saponaria]|uniref:Uncharacterized protein n=1 Tax=Quillaja saponaria TaxID=32244 RepID=A0AAD7PSN8_QUISA|nr:hypothetical protein O6P43_016179 [Quillaja saponaria]